MKIQRLRRNIIINLVASAILVLIAIGIFLYLSSTQDSSSLEVVKIRNETNEIRSQAQDLESQTKDARKYKDIWKALDENKKSTQGIKMDEVNTLLASLAEKYNIFIPSIQVLLPENLDAGVFQRKTLSVSYSSGTLSFESLSDVKALYFISEFFNNLPGYTIISTIEMGKLRKYLPEDYVNISLGKNPSILKVKVIFSWYTYHDKLKQVEVHGAATAGALKP